MRHPIEKKSKTNITLGMLIITVILLVSTLASVPPTSRDALVHHLSVPKIYLRHSGIYEIPSMDFSYFPMNLDLLYLIPLYFNQPIAAKYIHFFFALLTAWLIFTFLKKYLNSTYGLLGALFFLTIPIIVKLSVTVYVDLGLIFFSWASLFHLLRWHDTHFRTRHLVFSAVFCGLALGTKYNGLILILIMVALVPLLYSIKTNSTITAGDLRQRYGNSIKGLGWGLAFVIISLIVFSPWMIRNTIWKQNPVYPLFKSVFDQTKKEISTDVDKKKRPPHNAFWTRRYVYKESFNETVLIPIRAFFQGQDDSPKYFDGVLNPALLLFPIAAFWGIKRNKAVSTSHTDRNILALFSFLFMTIVLFKVDFRIRYMAPAIPPLVVLSIIGLKKLFDITSQKTFFPPRLVKGVVTSLVLIAFSFNAVYIYNQFDYIRPMDYIAGKIDRDAYIARYRIEHPAVVYANKNLPNNARVLCLSIGKRTFYVERDVHLALDFYNRNKEELTELTILKRLKRYGTTHILINRNSYSRRTRHFEPVEIAVLDKVLKDHTSLLYEENGVQLLEIDEVKPAMIYEGVDIKRIDAERILFKPATSRDTNLCVS